MTRRAPHRLFFVLAALSALAFWVLADIADEGHIFGVDFTVQAVVQNARHPSLERFMQELTDLGSGWFLVPLNLLLYLLLRLSDRRLAVAVLAISLGSVPVEGLAKWAVARPRPKLTPYGFPSGHVFVSVAFFGMLIYVIWIMEKRPAWRWIGTGVCVVLAKRYRVQSALSERALVHRCSRRIPRRVGLPSLRSGLCGRLSSTSSVFIESHFLTSLVERAKSA
jgi:hypothetical protein